MGALFGFVGTRPQQRINRQAQLKQQAVLQVQRLFKTAQTPTSVLYKDWTTDPLTATHRDQTGQRAHPHGAALNSLMPERIVWAASETATQDAGYLEGAVNAANAAVQQITARR